MMTKERYDDVHDLYVMCKALKKENRLNSEKIKALCYAVFGVRPGKCMIGYNMLRDVWTIRICMEEADLVDLEV